jgi:DNA-binding transcriptional LysR family regulator
MDRLKALEIFKSVVEKGSFAKAAKTLDVSAPATRAVQDLEAALGVRLLQRSSRRVAVTAVGHEVLQRSAGLLDQYRDMEALSSLSASEVAGTVRLVAPSSCAARVLGPALASFRALHPKVSIDLRVTDDGAAAGVEEADLAVCLGRDLRLSMIARRVGVARLGLYASGAYLARHGVPQHPLELQHHDCLTGDGIHPGPRWEFRHATTHETCLATIRSAVHSNNVETLTTAAMHGAGIVMLPDLLASDLVWEGGLQRVLAPWQAEPLDVYIAYRSRQHQPLRVRKLIDHLQAAIAAASSEPAAHGGAGEALRAREEMAWVASAPAGAMSRGESLSGA